ncbi:MAG TPA: hypothetical protein VIO58_15240 [Candidatus Methanoperedens sp.]
MIRKKLSEIFQMSKYINKYAKERLNEEAKKPHTGYEISDFEIRIDENPEISFSKTIVACLPIKSGKEIKKESVHELYIYQIIKPFTHYYDNCVVIFITARKCSQPLKNYIDKLNAVYNFPIGVVQEENLCSLFKYYNLLN